MPCENHLTLRRVLIFRDECSAQYLSHAEHVEELRGNRQTVQPIDPVLTSQIDRTPSVASDGIERPDLVLPIE